MNLLNELNRCMKDEQGAEKVEFVLIIAAITLPLIGIVLYYKDAMVRWMNESWGDVRHHEQEEFDPAGG